jgi:hypothetical protein
MPRFLTLGPDTNHDFASRRFLAFHGCDESALAFVEDPEEGVRRLLSGAADFFILCSVHPMTPRLLCDYAGRAFIADVFISSSKPLAVLTRSDVAAPRRLGLFAATIGLTATTRWAETVIEREGTLATIAARLSAGAYDSALTYRDVADAHPGAFRVEEEIESPDDAWLVLSRERATRGGVVARRDSVVGLACARTDAQSGT